MRKIQQQKNDQKVKYPHLNDRGGDVTKSWLIEWSFYSDKAQKMIRKQKRVPFHLSKNERYKWAHDYQTEIGFALVSGKYEDEGTAISDLVDRDKANISFEKGLEEILEVKKQLLKPNSFKDYRLEAKQLTDWVKANHEKLRLIEFTYAMAIRYLDESQRKKGLTNRTRNNKLAYLRTLFNDLISRRYIEENPFTNIRKEKQLEPQNYPFREHEKSLLIPEMKEKDMQLYFACQFLYYLFVRPSELIAMKVDQIQWKQHQVMVPNHFKSGRAKYLTISENFEKVLYEMNLHNCKPDWYVFGKKGVPGPDGLNKKSLASRFAKMRDSLGIPKHFVFYCWKHTGNLDAVLSGVNIKAIQRQNGHSSIEDTDKYLRSMGLEHNEQIRNMQSSFGEY